MDRMRRGITWGVAPLLVAMIIGAGWYVWGGRGDVRVLSVETGG